MDVELRGAIQAMLDDHMTSETHHPGYVLVPTAAFEKVRAVSLGVRAVDLADALKSLNDAMRFVLAFYEPGQTCLDTEALEARRGRGATRSCGRQRHSRADGAVNAPPTTALSKRPTAGAGNDLPRQDLQCEARRQAPR